MAKKPRHRKTLFLVYSGKRNNGKRLHPFSNAYNPYVEGEEKEYREPKEVLKEIEMREKELSQKFKEIKEKL